MSQWIGVHGVVSSKLDRRLILKRWIPAVANGLELATHCRYDPALDLVFYGDVLRRANRRRGSKGSDEIDIMTDLTDLDDDELADLTSAVEEMFHASVCTPFGK